MKKSKFVVSTLVVGLLSGSAFLYNSTSEEQTSSSDEMSVTSFSEVKGAKNATANPSKKELAPLPINEVAKEKIKIPLNLETKNIKNIKGKARSVLAEKRPGGFLIETFYPTDTENGDLIVAQSVNQYGVAQLMTDEIKKWYPDNLGGFKELNLKGLQAILNENEEDANTLHIITDTEIFTVAGQKTEMLLEVAEELINDFK